MISVCIPIHNYYVLPLVQSIAAQSDDVEIVCIDDGSSQEYIERNRPIADLGQYIILGKNVGRACVRNLFLQYAKGEYLLFLDDDCIVPEGFIARYDEAVKKNPNVVVGGRVYDRRFNDRAHRLRYKYGLRVECRSAEERGREPYRSFMTNNFLVSRNVMDNIRFDERLTGYGHEDTLFGYRLKQHGVNIMHIDNPVTNADVETNAIFLDKSVEAVESLSKIYDFMQDDDDFCRSVRLLHTYRFLRRAGLCQLVFVAFRCVRSCTKAMLESGCCISLKIFNFYKLGIFIENRLNR